jgi:lipopolysaccharide transport system ATP-binding protein
MSAVIKVENLSKQYRLGQVGTGTISHDLNRWWYKIRGKEDPYLKIGESNDRTTKGESDYVWALKDINFEVQQGEVLGIIGRNGAGKSTLLKILSRTTAPTTGSVKIKGRVASLLEVGTGFHPELSGRDNIFLNGAILGMTRREIQSKFDEIVDFAGVERYIDTPVKRYSSGMYVRLAFAVAAHLEPEILIVDEVLAVGDAEFQDKCIGKIRSISETGRRTVIFVSHNMGVIKKLCLNGLLIKDGRLFRSDRIAEIVKEYEKTNEKVVLEYFNKYEDDRKNIYIQSVFLADANGNKRTKFDQSEVFLINTIVDGNDVILNKYTIILTIVDSNQRPIFSNEVKIEKRKNVLEIESWYLVRGTYSLNCIIYIAGVEQFDIVENVCKFTIEDSGSKFSHLHEFDYGVVLNNFNWK